MESKELNKLSLSSGPVAEFPIDNQLKAGVVDRVPSHAAVSAELVKKQNVISSTDEIKEGELNLYFRPERAFSAVQDWVIKEIGDAVAPKQDKIKSTDDVSEGKNLYFTESRALAAVDEFVRKQASEAASHKQDPIHSSDDVSEGQWNQYFTPARAQKACIGPLSEGSYLAPAASLVVEALSKKQPLVQSSDDISEGSKNKYFSEDAVKAVVEAAVAPFEAQMSVLQKRCEELAAQIEAITPKWADSLMGGTGSVRVCVDITKYGARWQNLLFEAGRLTGIDSPTVPQKIG